MLDIEIKFGFDKLPGEGLPCSVCSEPMETKYLPYIQLGGATEASYIEKPMCEKCYLEKWGEESK